MRNRIQPALLILGVAVTRWLFRSRYLYDIDSVDFGLALKRFDPASFQPHPPGYFLYVCLGRLVNAVVPDANTALVAISIAASCAAAFLIYRLAERWYGRGPALWSVLLFLTSPLCWFHGTVALTYIVEAAFSALIGYWCWRVYSGESAYAIPASLALAVASGFRPSTALFLAPLCLFSIWRVGKWRRWGAIAAAAGMGLAWFTPMLLASGGAGAYFGALWRLWSTVPGRQTTLGNPAMSLARIATIGWIFVLCFGAASVLALRRGNGSASAAVGRGAEPGAEAAWPTTSGEPEPREALHSRSPRPLASGPWPLRNSRPFFVFVWLAPGFLFFSFVFLKFVNAGYLLVLCPPVFAILGARASRFAGNLRYRRVRWAAIAAGVAANCAIFLWAPVYCSYSSVRAFEREMASIQRDFAGLDPQSTLIVGFDSHFLGYRHAGYYLPQFATVQYPEVAFRDGPRVFAMTGRDTNVPRSFDVSRFNRFVFFPLPPGGVYDQYLHDVRARLAHRDLELIAVGRLTLLAGPASALPELFPCTARQAVYTPRLQARPARIRTFTRDLREEE